MKQRSLFLAGFLMAVILMVNPRAIPGASLLLVSDASGRAVSARYQSNSGQGFNSSEFAIVNFEDITYDPLGLCTTGASFKCTADRVGKWRVCATILFSTAAGWDVGEQAQMALYKNGETTSILSNAVAEVSSSNSRFLNGCDEISLALGDYIDVRGYQDSGGAVSLQSNAVFNYLTFTYIGY